MVFCTSASATVWPSALPAKKVPDDTDQTAQKAATANGVLRWNLLWFVVFCLIVAPMPLWLYPLHCLAGFVVVCAVAVWSWLVLFLCLVNATYTMVRLYRKGTSTSNQLPLSQVKIDAVSFACSAQGASHGRKKLIFGFHFPSIVGLAQFAVSRRFESSFLFSFCFLPHLMHYRLTM